MRSLVKTKTEASTETRLSWWAYLFVLDEFINDLGLLYAVVYLNCIVKFDKVLVGWA